MWQSEELQLLCSLGREAAEILWEMAALQDETDATKEMLENGDQLKVIASQADMHNRRDGIVYG